jgi:hypothetical protein
MVAALLTADGSQADLLGIATNPDVPDSNDLYLVSEVDASLEFLGQVTTPPFFGPLLSLELAPKNMHFGLTIDSIMKVDVDAGTAEKFLFAGTEGSFLSGLDFSPTGFGFATIVPFGVGGYTGFKVFDPDTAEVLGSGGIDGLDFWNVAFRPDGVLLGIDNGTNDVWQIDPFTGDVEFMFSLDPGVDTVIAMTTLGDQSFLVATDFQPGVPRKLYDFDLYTGETTLIGQIDPDVKLLGLAAVPSPAAAAVLALAGAVLARRRR